MDWNNNDHFKNFKIKKKKQKYTRCGVIIFNNNFNKILLVENNYIFVEQNKSKWGFPKGLIRKNENFNKCAMRELFEETGLNVNIEKKQPFLKINNNYYFPIQINEQDIKYFKPIDKKEIKDVRWISIDLINNCIRCNYDVTVFKKNYISRCKNIAMKMKLFKPNKFNLYETK